MCRGPHIRRPGQKLSVFGCGWWYDREIVLLPPLVKFERDYQTMNTNTEFRNNPGQEGIALHSQRALLGRLAADGCKPRHGRCDRKRERSFSGLSRARWRSFSRLIRKTDGRVTEESIPLSFRRFSWDSNPRPRRRCAIEWILIFFSPNNYV